MTELYCMKLCACFGGYDATPSNLKTVLT